MTDLEDLEQTLRDRLDAIGPTSRAVLQHTLMLPDHERARRIGDLFAIQDPDVRATPDRPRESTHSRAVVLGELRERELRGEP